MPPDASQAAASAAANHQQNPPQNQTETQRHTTHENSLMSLSEALKEEVTPPRQRPGEMPPDASHGRRFRNSKPPSDSAPKQTETQRHTTHENSLMSLSEALKEEVTPPRQRPGEMPPDASHGRRFRNSKPPSDSAPKPNKNAAPHHPRKLSNVAFWSPKRRKRRSDTAKATTRRDASRYIPGRRFRNSKPPSESAQNQTKTQRHTTHENSLMSLSEALKEEEEVTPPRQRPDCAATANHHQDTPQNQTKTRRHTTHENSLTSLSAALKEEEVTPPRQRPDCAATANHQQNTPQNHAKTHRDTTQKITISITSLARSPWNDDGVGGYSWWFLNWVVNE